MIPRYLRFMAGALRTGAIISALLLAPALTLVAPPALAGGIEGLSYTLNPGVEHIQWNKDVGLEDDMLYGGRFGLNFGRYVALRAFYFGNSDMDISAPKDAPDPNADFGSMDVANYGADMALHFPHGSVLPFLYAGGGVYRLDPSDGDRLKKVGLKLGGGIRFAITPRIETVIYAEDAMIRPGSGLATSKLDETGGGDNLEHNLALGAGLNFFLGGYAGETEVDRDYRNKFSGGITGASWKFEPFAGKLNYDSGVDLSDTELLGIRSGFGFGPYVDLRGYYWRGVESDFGKTEQIQSWGVESQFNLNPSPGVEPHILLGIGTLDFMSGYRDVNDMKREDETILIAGGGVSLTLGNNWHINLDARDYMFGPFDLEDTDNLDELFHNWMYTAGLTLAFGGRGSAPEAMEAEVVVLPAPVLATPAAAAPEKVAVETVIVEKEVSPANNGMASPVRTYQGDRVVTLPVPTVGEIYIRYGEPGGVSIESKTVVEEKPARADSVAAATPGPQTKLSTSEEDMVRKAVREAIGKEAADARAESLRTVETSRLPDEEQMKLFESRLMKKIDSRIEERVQEEVARRGAGASTTQGQPPVVVLNESAGSGGAAGTGLVFHGGQVYTGANMDKPNQWIIGGRLPLKRQGGTWPIYYVPEVAFGFLDESSTLIAVNMVWDLGDHFNVQGYRPYMSAGAGILFFSKKIDNRDKQEGVLDLGYGLAKDFGKYNGFIEHQGIDLYSLHRVIVGIGWDL